MNSMAGPAAAHDFDEAALKRGAESVRHPLARALLVYPRFLPYEVAAAIAALPPS